MPSRVVGTARHPSYTVYHMKKKSLVWLAVILGIVFVGVAIYYWMTPAGSLPPYSIFGYEAGSTHVHFKHGLASLILAIGLFIYAWFASAPKKSEGVPAAPVTPEMNQPAKTPSEQS